MNKHRGSDALAFVRDLVDADPDARREYERLGPRYELITKIVRARKDQGLTQAELAARMNVTRPAVSRLESGMHEPRFDLIQRAADALGQQFVVEFKPTTIRSKRPASRSASLSERPAKSTGRTRVAARSAVTSSKPKRVPAR
jgi:transcriptional regulator with XRE-family HTH domain